MSAAACRAPYSRAPTASPTRSFSVRFSRTRRSDGAEAGWAPPWSAGLREPFAGVGNESRLALLEPQLEIAGGPVAVLGELHIDDLAVGVLVLRGAILLAVEEQ